MSVDSFISIDWGTTNVRIRLAQTPSLTILEESIVPKGIKTMYDEWNHSGGSREDFFLTFLKKQISLFKHPIENAPPVIISGMASASIGLRELPYAKLPFSLNGTNLYFETIKSDIIPHQVILISGVRSETDVMRGEEVQLMGLLEKNKIAGKSIYILPGSHSKHAVCVDGSMITFRTFMTGELFQVISKHTILKNSISSGDLKGNALKAFEEGVASSRMQLSVQNELFKIRAFDLFKSKTKTENYYYLSGLLIGDELKTLLQEDFDSLLLCAGSNLFELYYRAIKKLDLLEKTTVISKETVDASVVKGQWRLLKVMKQ